MKTVLALGGFWLLGNSGFVAYLLWENQQQRRRMRRLNDPRVIDLTLWLAMREHPAGKRLERVK